MSSAFRQILTVLVLSCVGISLAPAALIYNNGVPDNVAGNSITNFRTVDDFVLAEPTSLESIRFWVIFDNNDPTGMFSGEISWAIYSNPGVVVGSLFASGAVSGLGMTNIGSGGGAFNAYQIEFSIGTPVALPAGSYWLELHEGLSFNAADGSHTHWASRGTGGNAMTYPFYGSFPLDLQPISSFFGCPSCDYDLAFQLLGTTDASVPEPATLWLSGFVLLALQCRRRTRCS